MKMSSVVQFVKFGIVGVSNTAVDWIVFLLLSTYLLHGASGELVSKAISFIVSVINSFIWNSKWTFRSEFKSVVKKNDLIASGSGLFLKFVIVSLVGWGINYYTYKYVHFTLDMDKYVSLVAASGAAVVWNYFANKLWTYKKTA